MSSAKGSAATDGVAALSHMKRKDVLRIDVVLRFMPGSPSGKVRSRYAARVGGEGSALAQKKGGIVSDPCPTRLLRGAFPANPQLR